MYNIQSLLYFLNWVDIALFGITYLTNNTPQKIKNIKLFLLQKLIKNPIEIY